LLFAIEPEADPPHTEPATPTQTTKQGRAETFPRPSMPTLSLPKTAPTDPQNAPDLLLEFSPAYGG